MTALARQLLENAGAPGAACGIAVAECFPDSPRVQAALRDFRARLAGMYGPSTSASLESLARELAGAHGLAEVTADAAPAIGVVEHDGRQSFALYDGATWWIVTPARGIRRCPPRFVRVAFEVS
jgi:hypothetical protein